MQALRKFRRKFRRARPAPHDSSAMTSVVLPVLFLIAALMLGLLIVG